MENLADKLKLYAAKKLTNNKRNTLVSKASVPKRKRLIARLAFCLLAETRWRNMGNLVWENYYRSEIAAMRNMLYKRPKKRVPREDLLSPLLMIEKRAA